MALTQDTPIKQAENTDPSDPQQTGSGSAEAPGGGAAPAVSLHSQTQGQSSYPGPRTGGESDKLNDTPVAGDTDPGSNASAAATGQAGDTTDPDKNKANPWNG